MHPFKFRIGICFFFSRESERENEKQRFIESLDSMYGKLE